MLICGIIIFSGEETVFSFDTMVQFSMKRSNSRMNDYIWSLCTFLFHIYFCEWNEREFSRISTIREPVGTGFH